MFALGVLAPAQCLSQSPTAPLGAAEDRDPSVDLALSLLEAAHPGVLLVADQTHSMQPEWIGPLPTHERSGLSTEHQLNGRLAPVPYASSASLTTSGRVAAHAGGEWSVNWNGNVAPQNTAFLWSQVEGDSSTFGWSDLYVHGQVGPHGFVRAGRYQPERLSAIGRVDGVQGEVLLNQIVSTGVVAGFQAAEGAEFKDTRSLAVAYLAAELAPVDTLQYTGTVGFLSTSYEGAIDRFAVLVEQNARLSRYLSVQSNSELDIYGLSESGGDSDLRLTAVNVSAESSMTSSFTLRAGFNHSKTPDIASERIAATVDDRAFEEGTWRHWLGGTHKLPLDLELSGELAFEDSYEEDGFEDSWIVALKRTGILFLKDATLSASFFTRDEGELRGYGGTIVGNLPMLDTHLSLRPSVTLTLVEPGERSVQPTATDMSIHTQWKSNEHLSLFIGSTYNFVETVTEDDGGAEVGIQFYW